MNQLLEAILENSIFPKVKIKAKWDWTLVPIVLDTRFSIHWFNALRIIVKSWFVGTSWQCQNFSNNNFNLHRGNFDYHNLGA